MKRLLVAALLAGACGDGGGEIEFPDAGTPDAAGPDPALVTTPDGPLRGEADEGYRVFRGIPYAAPPTGGNRWRAPKPVTPWTEERDATAFGHICPQDNSGGTFEEGEPGEDCLFANVWTPWPLPAEPLPVMLFIHGGAFTSGSGSSPLYDGHDLAARGVIVVTFNYRLGPLGFLALPQLVAEEPSSGMYGIQDQQAMLRWVLTHIASFGGDPEKVTVFGESAGGISINVHLVAPASRGLFARAIVESGPVGLAPTAVEAQAQGGELAAALGCIDPISVLTCLRVKPATEVIAALPPPSGLVLGDGASWGPSVDGVVVAQQPALTFLAGGAADVPVILGSNADEGTLFVALAGGVNEAAYHGIANLYGPQAAALVEAHYPLDSFPSADAAVSRILGDGGFVCSARREARALADAGNETYLYHFTYVYPTATALGAFHASELPFVFDSVLPGLNLRIDASRRPLSEQIQGYWTRMAIGGDPNGDGAFEWPAYTRANDTSLTLDTEIATQVGLAEDDCDFWDSLLPLIN